MLPGGGLHANPGRLEVIYMGGSRSQTSALERRFAVNAPATKNIAMANLMGDIAQLLENDPEIAAFEQIGGERHFRMDFADTLATGHAEFCAVSDGLYINVFEAELRNPMIRRYAWPDSVRIRIGRAGLEGCAPPGDSPVLVEGPSVMITVEPAGQAASEAAFSGSQKAAYVCLDRGTLQSFYRGREHELPVLLQAFIKGELTRTVARRASIRPQLLRCLDDLLQCDFDSLTRTLFMRSKAVEILCHTLKALEHDEGFGAQESSAATARGVLRAQRILTERFAAPPSLEDLAREVGVSRSSLCAGFRQIHGQSIYGYIHQLRMVRALQLLTESQDPVTEIAYATGFRHLSSFTVAVQRRFGMNPSELRRSSRSTGD